MIRVLFVCLGNICRSPMAEAIFRDLVKKEKLAEKIATDSCGIGPWHVGEPPQKGTRDLLDKHQISYAGMRARQITEQDLQDFDYIIAMDDQNIKDLQKTGRIGDGVVAKLMDFAENPGTTNIPDPYYTGNFEYVYELVLNGCTGLLKHIRESQHI